MNIQTAVAVAMALGKRISRPGWPTAIEPTNTDACCIIHMKDGSQLPGPRWNPTAVDLVADDWTIVSAKQIQTDFFISGEQFFEDTIKAVRKASGDIPPGKSG